MKRLLFIYNPKAGRSGIVSELSDVIDIFTKAGYEVTVHPTQCRGDGQKIACERAESFDRIVCSGGDGTLDEIVSGVMQSGVNIPIGYIPTGSTNDFSRSVGIPRNAHEAASIAVGDHIFKCDLGKFNEDYFVYVAAFGLFTDVTYETDQNLKKVFGYAAYLAEAVKSLQTIKPIPLTITYDETVLQGDFLVGMISNSTSVGGMKLLPGPGVDLQDGLFEVLLIKRPDSIMEFNSIPLAMLDRSIHSDCVISIKCSKINIESDEPFPWTLDGEFGGNVRSVEISNLRNAMEIVVP